VTTDAFLASLFGMHPTTRRAVIRQRLCELEVALEAERTRALALETRCRALAQYASHDGGCPMSLLAWTAGDDGPCTCGVSDLVASLETAPETRTDGSREEDK